MDADTTRIVQFHRVQLDLATDELNNPLFLLYGELFTKAIRLGIVSQRRILYQFLLAEQMSHVEGPEQEQWRISTAVLLEVLKALLIPYEGLPGYPADLL
jgi:hypothetical protein